MPRCQRQQLHRNLSKNVVDGRRVLCGAIADLPSDSSCDHVSSILEPLLGSLVEGGTHDSSDGVRVSEEGGGVAPMIEGDGVTPMMVACDKSQLGCLEFIERKISEGIASEQSQQMIDLVGHPLDCCLDEFGGNSAAHLAASSGFAVGIDLLVTILETVFSQDNERANITEDLGCRLGQGMRWNGQAMQDDSSTRHRRLDLYLVILATVNAHNDTPIMIASASGHSSFLSHLLRRIYPDDWEGNKLRLSPSAKCDRLSLVRSAFEMKNKSGDSALSLACGHGHSAVVDVLINSVVNVKYEDLEKAKNIEAKTDKALEAMRQKGHSRIETYEKQGKSVRRCLVMLQVKQAQIARESMENLLSEERQNDACRQKKKRTGKSTTKPTSCPSKSQNNLLQNVNVAQKSSGSYSDGADGRAERDRVVVPQQTIEDTICKDSSREDILDIPSVSQNELKPTDKVLVEQCGLPIAVSSEKDEVATTLEAEMESLCLDTSMLLLTPHGMAMKLSPSQLDVIENVLENQLAAVQEAREIQSRLLSLE